jgi:23S rRNA (pseudouridine1915-N3)-methyltransferase
VYKSFEDGGSHVSFIIGGFAGLPDGIRSAYPLLTLSKMTWTHQMARLLLLEQIYRASEIFKGSAYHKD